MNDMNPGTKGLFAILIGMTIITMFAIYFGVIRHRIKINHASNIKIEGVVLPQSKEIAKFQLTDNHGNAFTNDNLKGHWTMLFFGFTNCGMVCPTTMAALNRMYKELEKELPADKLPQVVLVTVDPERDTTEKLDEYVNAFNSHFIGARTELAETLLLEREFSIAAVKMQADGMAKNNYSINHSAEILLINPDGKIKAYFSYPHKAEKMVKDYKLILAA